MEAVPNPFNPSTTIKFEMVRAAHVDVGIYNLAGRLVAKLRSGMMSAGNHEVVWEGLNEAGGRVASGVYNLPFDERRLH